VESVGAIIALQPSALHSTFDDASHLQQFPVELLRLRQQFTDSINMLRFSGASKDGSDPYPKHQCQSHEYLKNLQKQYFLMSL
jgi:hypothetical protein